MARKEMLEKLEEQLTCSICLDNYTNPKILPCFHSFCQKCLDGVRRNEDSSLPCPTCRAPCKLPESGVASLSPSFVLNNLEEFSSLLKKGSAVEQHVACDSCQNNAVRYCEQCATFLCQECLHRHDDWKLNTRHQSLTMDEVATLTNQQPTAKPVIGTCTEHNKPLETFCETCEKLMCITCTVKKHKNHDFDLVSDMYDKHRRVIERSLIPLNQKMDELSDILSNLVRRKRGILQQGKATKEDIHQTVVHIKELLDQTEKQLSGDVDSAVKHKLCVLDQQIEEVETALSQMKECRDHIDKTLKVGTPNQILSAKSQMMGRSESVIGSVKGKSYQPLEQADIKLTKSLKISEVHKNVATVSYTYHPAKVTLSQRDSALSGRESSVNIVFSRFDGFSAPVPSSLISCTVTLPGNVQPIKCSLKESPQTAGQYNVFFTPAKRGLHQLHVRVQGVVIPGSPLTVTVSAPPETMGTPVKTITGIKEPGGVAVTDDELVIVSEFHSHCVTILDKDGKKIRKFGSHGIEKGQFDGPQGVAVSAKETILVADFHNCRIQEFTMEGKCVSCVGSKGNCRLQFNEPLGIAFNKNTKQLYIADRRNNRIQVLNSDLTFSHMFGSKGSKQGEFDLVHDVGFDDKGFVYVADFNNHRIQKFTLEGQFVLSLGGSKGYFINFQISYPDGIVVRDDLVFVSEGRNTNCMTVFTTMGKYVHRFGNVTFRRSAFDKHGYLYLSVDNGISVF